MYPLVAARGSNQHRYPNAPMHVPFVHKQLEPPRPLPHLQRERQFRPMRVKPNPPPNPLPTRATHRLPQKVTKNVDGRALHGKNKSVYQHSHTRKFHLWRPPFTRMPLFTLFKKVPQSHLTRRLFHRVISQFLKIKGNYFGNVCALRQTFPNPLRPPNPVGL